MRGTAMSLSWSGILRDDHVFDQASVQHLLLIAAGDRLRGKFWCSISHPEGGGYSVSLSKRMRGRTLPGCTVDNQGYGQRRRTPKGSESAGHWPHKVVPLPAQGDRNMARYI